MLTREAILKAGEVKRVEVEIPDWEGTIFIQQMTADAMDAIESQINALGGNGFSDITKYPGFRARMLVHSIVDEDGNPLLKEEDIAALGRKSIKGINIALAKIFEINGLNVSMEKAVKNSEATQGEGSNTD